MMAHTHTQDIYRGVERRVAINCLKINVTASIKQLLRDGRLPILGRDIERRAPILCLNINVAANAALSPEIENTQSYGRIGQWVLCKMRKHVRK